MLGTEAGIAQLVPYRFPPKKYGIFSLLGLVEQELLGIGQKPRNKRSVNLGTSVRMETSELISLICEWD
jgi:hypothetical protein